MAGSPGWPDRREAEYPREMQILTIIEQDGRRSEDSVSRTALWSLSRACATLGRAYRRPRTRGYASIRWPGNPERVPRLRRCSMIEGFCHVRSMSRRATAALASDYSSSTGTSTGTWMLPCLRADRQAECWSRNSWSVTWSLARALMSGNASSAAAMPSAKPAIAASTSVSARDRG